MENLRYSGDGSNNRSIPDQYRSYRPDGTPWTEARPVKHQIQQSLAEMLGVLRRGKWLALGVLVAVVSVMTVHTLRMPPEYDAYTLLVVDPQGAGKEAELLNYGVLGGTSFDVRTQLLILQQSLVIAEKTADRLQELEQIPDTGEPIAILNDREGAPRLRSELAKVLQERHVVVTSEGDWRSGAIRITAASPSPDEAALIANIYSEEYVELSKETSRQRISASRAFLETQLAKRQEDLQRFQEQISTFIKTENAMPLMSSAATAAPGGAQSAPAPGGTTAQTSVAQIVQLESNLEETKLELTMKEATLRALEDELEQLRPLLVEQLEPTSEKDIERLQTEIARLTAIVEPIYARNPELMLNPGDNVELRDLQQRIAALDERKRELQEAYTGSLAAHGGTTKEQTVAQVAQVNRQIVEHRIQIDALKSRIASLESRLAEQRLELQALPKQSSELAQLERARFSIEEQYRTLASKLQETRIAEESEVGYVRIVRPARPPDEPERPNKGKNLMLALILGTSLGFLAAIARNWVDHRVYLPSDLAARNLRMLGAIPDFQTKRRRMVLMGGREISPTIVTLLHPNSAFAEAYRQLYVSLQFSAPNRVVQTILVTSAETGAGKSTTAVNLAVTIARTGRRTLLIDGDLRRPSIHKYLGSSTRSIASAISVGGHLDFADVCTDVPNFHVMSTPETSATSSELLGSPAAGEMIARLKAEFDVIVLDAPPILALADAGILSRFADAALIVVGAGKTNGDALSHAVRQFEEINAPLVGVVLNRFNAVYPYRATYGYYYSPDSKYYASTS